MNKWILLCAGLIVADRAHALSLTLQVQNETCTYANGSVTANPDGGVPPYTYAWSTGGVDQGITGLSAGTYSVTVTDFVGTQVTDAGTVVSGDYGVQTSGLPHSYCPGQNYREFFFLPGPNGLPDMGPWTASQGIIDLVPPPAGPLNYYLDIGPIAPGSQQTVTYWDVNGCSGSLSFTAGEPITSWPAFAAVDVDGSCANLATGGITVATSSSPYWDTYYVLKVPGSGEYDWISNTPTYVLNTLIYSSLQPGDYWLMDRLALTPSLLQGGGCKSDSILVTIPDLGPSCGVISGSTYMDYDSNCSDTEADAMNVVVEVQPGPYYATSGGSYSVVVPNGSYTLTTTGTAIAQSCPAAATVNGNYAFANIGHQPTVPLDVAISLASGPARPGFELEYIMHVENMSSSSSGNTTTTFTFDPAVSFISATASPTVSGNTLTWNQGALGIFQQHDYLIRLQVPPDVGLIGMDLLASAAVATANTDGDLSNNSASASITVTGSFDPNDKVAMTSTRASSSLYFVNEDEWIDYVIRFQNTGTDLAFNIVVTDTLPATLNPATISMVSASHPYVWSIEGQGTLKFIFPSILLPDSNTNEAASHGLISFRIRPKQPLLPGTVIENTANIFFDFNDPVISEPSVLTAEFSTQVAEQGLVQIRLGPNPANERLSVSTSELVERVQVIAADGRIVLIAAPRSTTFDLNIDHLSPGAYLLLATTQSGHIERQRFIKH